MKKHYLWLFLLLCLCSIANAREHISIVGSSTLYPFITVVAEKFGKTSGHTPVVEATGTGGGFRLLCSGNSLHYPDIVNASRMITAKEEKFCANHGINHLEKILIGYDGIIIAQSNLTQKIHLSKEQLFMALARKVPLNGKLVDNFYQNWQQISENLPNRKIEIYGPSYTSGTRDAFIELVMEHFCEHSSIMKNLLPDDNIRKTECSNIREDGHYIEMPENDNIIIQKLIKNKIALGIISFSLLAENPKIQAVTVNNVAPNAQVIISGKYSLSRPLFVYINKDHIKFLPSIMLFIRELTSNEAIGKNGYLTLKGLLTKTEKIEE